jgi:hypothetical protein
VLDDAELPIGGEHDPIRPERAVRGVFVLQCGEGWDELAQHPRDDRRTQTFAGALLEDFG